MTRIGPAIADHWAVSTRSDGAIQTVETSLPGIQLGVLGVPQGFTADEIRNWLRDLAGVAFETSRTDPRPRPIPQVLHHALTGLLFSQSELWSKTGQPVPLSVVFMDDPNGLAFGWVGQARIRLRVNGLPHEPRWVLVRDEAGHQAVSTRLPADVHVSVELEYRPHGEDGTPTTAWLRAEWGTAREPDAERAPAEAPLIEVEPTAQAVTLSPDAPEAVVAPPTLRLPDSLPTEQPGLAQASDRPSTFHPSASTFVMPRVPSFEGPADAPAASSEREAPPVLDVVPVTSEGLGETPVSEPIASEDMAPPETLVDSTLELAWPDKPQGNATAASEAMLPPPALWTPAGPSAPARPVLEAPLSVPSVTEPVVAEAASAPEYVAPIEVESPPSEHEPAPLVMDESTSASAVVEAVVTNAPEVTVEVEPAANEPSEPVLESMPTLLAPEDTSPSPTSGTPIETIATRSEAQAPPEPPSTSSVDSENSSEPRHPVAKWLSRVLGRAPKSEASEPLLEDASEPVVGQTTSAPGLAAASNASAAPTHEPSEPTDDVTAIVEDESSPSVTESEPAATTLEETVAVAPAGDPADAAPISSYDALLSTEAETPSAPAAALDAASASSPPRPVNFGLAPVSLADVMRRRASNPVQSMPTPSAASPAPPSASDVAPPRLAVVREPVGADPSFGIPRVPQREPARPVAAPRPEPLPWRAVAPPVAATPAPVVDSTPEGGEVAPVLPEPPLELLAALEQSATAVPETIEAGLTIESLGVTMSDPVGEVVSEADTEPVVHVAEPVVEAVAPPAVVEPEPVVDVVSEPAATVEVVTTEPLPVTSEDMPTEAPTSDAEATLELIEVVTPQAEGLVEVDPVIASTDATESHPATVEPIEGGEAEPVAVETEATLEPVAAAPASRITASEEASAPTAPRVRSHHWPSPHDLEVTETPLWRRPWLIGTLVAVLFGIGWWLGHQEPRTPTSNASPIARMLSAVGLGGAHFSLKVESDPPGAWIAIDGKDTGQRTPATFQLKPGLHRIRYSLADLGSHLALVTGSNGQDRVLSEALHGNLEVRASNPGLPVRMSLDGQDQGFLPVTLTQLPPGLHQMQFSGPDLQPWAQTVNVPIRGTAHVEAQPIITPATGVLQVQATLNDDAGAAPLKGATVYVDGELRGRTPLKLELARGPHSLRVTYDDERAPVQVIDLPGGNERFATFAFGIDNDLPVLRLQGDVARLSATKPVTVSATLEGMAVRDVREAHLHVKGADGLWRRLDLTARADARGVVVSAPFPVTLLRGQSRTPWYMSVSSTQGDEFFTEIQRTGR